MVKCHIWHSLYGNDVYLHVSMPIDFFIPNYPVHTQMPKKRIHTLTPMNTCMQTLFYEHIRKTVKLIDLEGMCYRLLICRVIFSSIHISTTYETQM